MRIKCATEGCEHGAKVAPEINVPAVGWSVEMHRPLSVMMLIKLCDDCFKEFSIDDFLGPRLEGEEKNMRGIFELLAKGKQAPDFDRAWISRVLISSDKFQDFERIATSTEKEDPKK